MITSTWVRVILSVSVLVVLLTYVDVREAGFVLTTIDIGYFMAAVMVDLGCRAIMIERWALLLGVVGSSVPTWSVVKVFFISSFLGAAMPTGGADLARAYVLSRYSVGTSEAAATVVVDRVVGIVSLMVLGTVSFVLGAPGTDFPFAILLAGCSVMATAALLAVLWADRFVRLVAPKFLRHTAIGQWLLGAVEAMALYRTRRKVVAAVFGLSLLVQFIRVVEISLLGKSLHLGVGFDYYLVFMPIALLVLMLPVSILGIGFPQGVIIWSLLAAEVTHAQSFALSTLVVLLGIIGTLPGAYFYLRAR